MKLEEMIPMAIADSEVANGMPAQVYERYVAKCISAFKRAKAVFIYGNQLFTRKPCITRAIPIGLATLEDFTEMFRSCRKAFAGVPADKANEQMRDLADRYARCHSWAREK